MARLKSAVGPRNKVNGRPHHYVYNRATHAETEGVYKPVNSGFRKVTFCQTTYIMGNAKSGIVNIAVCCNISAHIYNKSVTFCKFSVSAILLEPLIYMVLRDT